MDTVENSSWSSATNWTVSRGSLHSSVSFESSFSAIEECVGSAPKSPLVLIPPGPDCGPCEIKISFTRKHELRQVYVRTSARVYEIYYASNAQSSNEYLCTVRCSMAAKEEEVIYNIVEDGLSENVKGHIGKESEEKLKNGSNTSTSEDDWVEVKVPDNGSLQKRSDASIGRSIQDFYEATAEITDADPCICLTIRLLSLQNKECIYVDEVYVFADPIDSDDSENQEGEGQNSGQNPLMTMLVPTLLQLSKSGISERRTYQEHRSKETNSISTVNRIQMEEKSNIAADTVKNSKSFPKESELPFKHLEIAVDQLVARVSRIENLLLRFEENMVKPISSMESRLQQLEQKLEILAKKPQYSEFASGKISAPEFSCNESQSNSFHSDGSAVPSCVAEQDGDFPSNKLSIPPADTHLLPGLVVTAPEFSNDDEDEDEDEEDIDTSEPGVDYPRDETKRRVSIDDALANALASFLYSNPIQNLNSTQSLTVDAMELLNEGESGDDKNDSTHSLKDHCEDSLCLKEIDDSDPPQSLDIEGKLMGFLEDSSGELTVEVDYKEEESNEQIENVEVIDETDGREASNRLTHSSVTDDSFNATKVSDLWRDADRIHNVLGIDCSSPLVDFGIPILDVKFVSQENSLSRSSLEALLTEPPEFMVEAPHDQENDDGAAICEPNMLISVEYEGVESNVYDYKLSYVPSELEGEKLQGPSECGNNLLFESLI